MHLDRSRKKNREEKKKTTNTTLLIIIIHFSNKKKIIILGVKIIFFLSLEPISYAVRTIVFVTIFTK
jgi:hypothetical protein